MSPVPSLIEYFLRSLAEDHIYYEIYGDIYAFYDTKCTEIGESEFLCTIRVGERCQILEVAEFALQRMRVGGEDDYLGDFEPQYLKQRVLLVTYFPGSSRSLSVNI